MVSYFTFLFGDNNSVLTVLLNSDVFSLMTWREGFPFLLELLVDSLGSHHSGMTSWSKPRYPIYGLDRELSGWTSHKETRWKNRLKEPHTHFLSTKAEGLRQGSKDLIWKERKNWFQERMESWPWNEFYTLVLYLYIPYLYIPER